MCIDFDGHYSEIVCIPTGASSALKKKKKKKTGKES